ncbi:MAG TPA: alpha/beta hydrolase [Chloroflexota bacterium]
MESALTEEVDQPGDLVIAPSAAHRADHTWQRRLGRAVLGGAGGVLSLSIAAGWYVTDTLTRASRVSVFDDYTFTPYELGLPWEDVSIPSGPGAPLSGWWFPQPDSDQVVIVCYGYRNRKAEMLGVGAALWRHGFNVLLFDYHGHGAHVGTRVTLGYRELDDVLAAVEYVCRRLPTARVGLLGYSMGAAIAIMAAARDGRVRTVIADSPFAAQQNPVRKRLRQSLHVPQAGSPLLFLADQFLYRLLGYHFRDVEPLREVAALGSRPLLLVHGMADSTIDYRDSELLYAAAPGTKELWLLPGVEHCGAYFHGRVEYVERILAFFDRSL